MKLNQLSHQPTLQSVLKKKEAVNPMQNICFGFADNALPFHLLEKETFKDMVISLAEAIKNNKCPNRRTILREMSSLKVCFLFHCIGYAFLILAIHSLLVLFVHFGTYFLGSNVRKLY